MKQFIENEIDKALDVCEALGRAPRGMSLAELGRALRQPPPTLHRLLAVNAVYIDVAADTAMSR